MGNTFCSVVPLALFGKLMWRKTLTVSRHNVITGLGALRRRSPTYRDHGRKRREDANTRAKRSYLPLCER